MSLSIKTKLILCIVGLGAALAALGGIGFYTSHYAAEREQMLAEHHIAPIYRLKQLSDAYAVTVVDSTHRVAFGEFAPADAVKSLEAARTQIGESWAAILKTSEGFVDGEAEAFASVISTKDVADAAFDKFEGLLKSGDMAALEAFRTTELYPTIDPLTGAIEVVVKLLTTNGTSDAAADKVLLSFLEAVMAAIAAVSALLLLGALWIVLRQVVKPINAMTGAMTSLAKGDNAIVVPGIGRKDEIGQMATTVETFKQNAIAKLQAEETIAKERSNAEKQRTIAEQERQAAEQERALRAREQSAVVSSLAEGLRQLSSGNVTTRLDAEFPQDYEQLRHDFNDAMAKLQDALKRIATGAESITTGSSEISNAADDLSRRTEQQAASLEQTAAALDQITATVKKSAEGANSANAVVAAARKDGETSGEIVRKAVAAMGEIEKSAKQISQIIGVIDEIAFQTNLLALNAGVEAARAGEAGRGFAVVASEVRALAQRSADAAKQIKGLISESSQQVEDGVELVGEAGESLVRILEQIGRISHLVSEIAGSAKEQATGLTEVNSAVNQMDQVTQQNAAMVEESTAASRSLAKEAADLASLVSEFNIGERVAMLRSSGGYDHAPRNQGRSTTKQMRTTSQRKVLPAPAEADWEEF